MEASLSLLCEAAARVAARAGGAQAAEGACSARTGRIPAAEAARTVGVARWRVC